MNHEDFPGIYQASDEASINAQRIYLRLIAFYLGLLVIAAICNLIMGTSTCLAIFAAFILIIIILLSILLAVKRYDRTWYNARAVAESVKTVTWRYMMHAEPFENSEENVVKSEFINTLKQILEQNKQLAQAFIGDTAVKDAISNKMTNIRSKELEERIKIYIQNRIDDQRGWYNKKAVESKRKALLWFIAICIAHAGALLCILIRIAKPMWTYLPVDIFIVLAGSFLTWMQTKKFQDISAAYTLTAHEISLMRSQISNKFKEDEFSVFVNDAENAFSREHTQWQARRQS